MKEKLIGNMLYGQSGGPTSMINTSAFGLFKEAFKHQEIKEIYATKFGIKGILTDTLIRIQNKVNLPNLINTPGAYFGSNRYKLKKYDEDHESYELILKTFKKHNIRYFFYNGGNDSMDTIRKISDYFKLVKYECNCIGIIKTIDNDLVSTDFSLGYPTAAKFIINSVIEITLDDLSYEEGRVNIIETMGRNEGWLAASSKLASIKRFRT
jgi:6-phosphofructokinase